MTTTPAAQAAGDLVLAMGPTADAHPGVAGDRAEHAWRSNERSLHRRSRRRHPRRITTPPASQPAHRPAGLAPTASAAAGPA
jgi:hypothetical protein